MTAQCEVEGPTIRLRLETSKTSRLSLAPLRPRRRRRRRDVAVNLHSDAAPPTVNAAAPLPYSFSRLRLRRDENHPAAEKETEEGATKCNEVSRSWNGRGPELKGGGGLDLDVIVLTSYHHTSLANNSAVGI